jgi:hypothetical protein
VGPAGTWAGQAAEGDAVKSEVARPALAAALSISLLGLAPAAQATEVPEEQRLVVNRVTALEMSGDRVTLMAWELGVSGSSTAPAAGDAWSVQLFSCGQLFRGEVGRWGGTDSGIIVDFTRAEEELIGSSIEYVITNTRSGFDPYSISESYSAFSTERPSCEQILHPLEPSWSRKDARRTVVGHTISVTPTVVPGAEVTYAWKRPVRLGVLLGRTLGTGPSIRLKRAWIGRGISVVVKVRKHGYETLTKTIDFPKVRKR